MFSGNNLWGHVHFKDFGVSIVTVGYCILVPDFYLVLYYMAFDAEKNNLVD